VKLTKERLKKIIKEELAKVMRESAHPAMSPAQLAAAVSQALADANMAMSPNEAIGLVDVDNTDADHIIYALDLAVDAGAVEKEGDSYAPTGMPYNPEKHADLQWDEDGQPAASGYANIGMKL
jgi:hypothetical protein